MSPAPTERVETIPPGFDPDKHCGASTAKKSACMMGAGFKTDHQGYGRCGRHGGKGGRTLNGVDMKTQRYQSATFDERVESFKNSDDLLTLDDEIATLKALMQVQIDFFSAKYESFQVLAKLIEDGYYDEDDPPILPEAPNMDTRTVDTLNRLINTAFNMRYAKRHSIPIAELESVMLQIVSGFNTTLDALLRKLGPEAVADIEAAKAEFGKVIRGLRMSRPTDVQLDRAAGVGGSGSPVTRDLTVIDQD